MIPETAIEAAARAIHDVHCGCGEKDRYEYSAINVEQAEAALEAALPHIRTQIASELRSAAARLDPGSRGQGEYLIHGLEQAALLVEAEGNK